MDPNAPHLTFVVGEEKRLAEIIMSSDIRPLLASALAAGFRGASVLDGDGLSICTLGEEPLPLGGERPVIRHALSVEGEPSGTLALNVDAVTPLYEAAALIIRDALQLTITNNLKRILTTEVHTSVVQESYDQLVESNRRLAESEARYRNLALELERKVEERTAELKTAYSRMLQQEKLAAVGQLAAGMAHEINNPNGFILSNLNTLRKYVARLGEMLEFHGTLMDRDLPAAEMRRLSVERGMELRLDYILADTGELLAQSIEGAERIRKIVADLKSFSHIDEAPGNETDLNEELERTLSVLGPAMPPDARVEFDRAPLPRVRCNPGLICQAFVNIIQNSLLSRERGLRLRLGTAWEAGRVVITIGDNGCGIPPEQLGRVFDPFFTTREVGRGTGMGLTVAREIIVSCGGTIAIDSDTRNGTTVTITLAPQTGEG
ncbi:MAG TPA: ATP-binding protein [Desulfuromonadaceae bacterium]